MFPNFTRALKLFVAPLFVVSTSAAANNFNYHFFEFRVGSSPQSLGAEYSYPINDNFHVVGRVDSQFEHDGDIAAGIGFNGPVNQFIDIYGQALGHYINYPNTGSHKKNEGLTEFNLGARLWILEQIEGHVRLGTMNDHTTARVGVRFHSTDQLSVGANIINNGIWGSQFAIDVRAEF